MSVRIESYTILAGIISLVLIFAVFASFHIAQGKQFQHEFSEEVMNELNKLWLETPQDTEFFVIIEEQNKSTLVGYKNLTSNKVQVVDYKTQIEGNIFLHSHPQSKLCIKSFQDLSSKNEIDCIMCGENKVRCWE
jgi:hypothetical protein